METLVGLLMLVGIVVLYLFVFIQPQYANKRALGIYNISVLGVCLFLCLVVSLSLREHLDVRAYEKYGRLLTASFVLGVETVFLTVFFLARNFWIFRPTHRVY